MERISKRILGSLIIFLFVIMFMPSVASARWTVETVDDSRFFTSMSSRSLALDDNGNPHIAYGEDRLYYAYFDGSSWNYETPDPSSNVGYYASIALDSSGKVHISYYDATNKDLRYASNTSGSWMTDTLDNIGDVGAYASIAIDSSDKVHISYYDRTNGDLRYVTNASGSWVTETLDSDDDVGSYTSIAIDSSDKVHISYSISPNYRDLRYATNTSGSWVIETADSAGSTGYYTSIALDSSDKVHISYFDLSNDRLMYATNMSGSWVSEVAANADDDGYIGKYTSIAIDSSDKAHISHLHFTDWDSWHFYFLKYSTNASGSWMTEIVVESNGGFYTSLAMDSSDNAHISYEGNCTLNYATNSSGSWVTEKVDTEGTAGHFSSIAIDSANQAHISYEGNCALRYATVISGLWSTETPDNSKDVGLYTSIAIDSSDNALISNYKEVYNEDWRYYMGSLKFATNSTGSWMIETIEYGTPYDNMSYDGRDRGRHSSIAVDSSDKVHISYMEKVTRDSSCAPYYIFCGYLKYATNASGTWVTEYVERAGASNGGNIFIESDIAVDSTEKVHISYSGQDGLRYATKDSGPWVIETLDISADVGRYSSIAVDSSDKVHISYYDVTNGDLKYATNASGSWSTETLDSGGDVGKHSSIAIDSSDKVHISYYDATSGDLKYTTNASGSWLTGTLDSDGDTGQYTSIGIDTSDKVHISYHDATKSDLKYTTNAPVDRDEDDYLSDVDCDDNDPLEHPDQTWYLDADNDGYSDGTVDTSSCERPLGYKAASELTGLCGDCNDNNPVLNNVTLWHSDFDGDGFGNPAVSQQRCRQPEGYVLDYTDCIDYDVNIYPGGPQVRITGSPFTYYSTLLSAYNAASEWETDYVQIKGNLSGDLNFNLNKSVILDGGYECAFTNKTGMTILRGNITISDGVVTIGDFDLR
jgi:hypothetical protein